MFISVSITGVIGSLLGGIVVARQCALAAGTQDFSKGYGAPGRNSESGKWLMRLVAHFRHPSSSTQRSAALRQATETDSGGSVTLGLAMRGLERLAVQRLYRQSRDGHRLAPERLSLVLGLEGPTR
jgi:hypothetical protein